MSKTRFSGYSLLTKLRGTSICASKRLTTLLGPSTTEVVSANAARIYLQIQFEPGGDPGRFFLTSAGVSNYITIPTTAFTPVEFTIESHPGLVQDSWSIFMNVGTLTVLVTEIIYGGS